MEVWGGRGGITVGGGGSPTVRTSDESVCVTGWRCIYICVAGDIVLLCNPFGIAQLTLYPFWIAQLTVYPFGIEKLTLYPFGITQLTLYPFGIAQLTLYPFGIAQHRTQTWPLHICWLTEILYAIRGKFLVVIRIVRYQRRSLTEVSLYIYTWFRIIFTHFLLY